MNQTLKHSAATQPAAGKLRYMLCGGALVGIGIAIGSVIAPPTTARAEVREQATPGHFLSGDQLSVPLLQDISATLRQIDSRLARLEAAVKQMANAQQNP